MAVTIDYTNKIVLPAKASPTSSLAYRNMEPTVEHVATGLDVLTKKVDTVIRDGLVRTMNFYNIVCAGATTITLEHNFGGKVWWYMIDAQDMTPAAADYIYRDSTNSTVNKLVLTANMTGTIAIRVEAAQ